MALIRFVHSALKPSKFTSTYKCIRVSSKDGFIYLQCMDQGCHNKTGIAEEKIFAAEKENGYDQFEEYFKPYIVKHKCVDGRQCTILIRYRTTTVDPDAWYDIDIRWSKK